MQQVASRAAAVRRGRPLALRRQRGRALRQLRRAAGAVGRRDRRAAQGAGAPRPHSARHRVIAQPPSLRTPLARVAAAAAASRPPSAAWGPSRVRRAPQRAAGAPKSPQPWFARRGLSAACVSRTQADADAAATAAAPEGAADGGARPLVASACAFCRAMRRTALTRFARPLRSASRRRAGVAHRAPQLLHAPRAQAAAR